MPQQLIRCRIRAVDHLHKKQYEGYLMDVAGPVVGIEPPAPWRSVRGIMLEGPLKGQSVEIARALVQVESEQGEQPKPAGPKQEPPAANPFTSVFEPTEDNDG